jgi:hypothetical protein
LLLLSVGRNAMHQLLRGDPLGRISLMFWLIALVYNNAESDFFILEPLWFTLLLIGMDTDFHRRQVVASSIAAPASDAEALSLPRVDAWSEPGCGRSTSGAV